MHGEGFAGVQSGDAAEYGDIRMTAETAVRNLGQPTVPKNDRRCGGAGGEDDLRAESLLTLYFSSGEKHAEGASELWHNNALNTGDFSSSWLVPGNNQFVFTYTGNEKAASSTEELPLVAGNLVPTQRHEDTKARE